MTPRVIIVNAFLMWDSIMSEQQFSKNRRQMRIIIGEICGKVVSLAVIN